MIHFPRQRYAEGFQASSLGPRPVCLGKGAAPRVRFGNLAIWVGLGWLGLGWVGLAWVGLASVGLGWLGLAWPGLAWLGLAWCKPNRWRGAERLDYHILMNFMV